MHTDYTAAFMVHRHAAFRTGIVHRNSLLSFFQYFRFGFDQTSGQNRSYPAVAVFAVSFVDHGRIAVYSDIPIFINYPADSVRAGHDIYALASDTGRTANSANLFNNRVYRNTGTQRDGNQASRCFRLGSAAPCPSGIGKHLTNAFIVSVDAYIQVAAANFYFFGYTDRYRRSRSGYYLTRCMYWGLSF